MTRDFLPPAGRGFWIRRPPVIRAWPGPATPSGWTPGVPDRSPPRALSVHSVPADPSWGPSTLSLPAACMLQKLLVLFVAAQVPHPHLAIASFWGSRFPPPRTLQSQAFGVPGSPFTLRLQAFGVPGSPPLRTLQLQAFGVPGFSPPNHPLLAPAGADLGQVLHGVQVVLMVAGGGGARLL